MTWKDPKFSALYFVFFSHVLLFFTGKFGTVILSGPNFREMTERVLLRMSENPDGS